MGKEGYLYIIYLDNKGNTGLLYPNAISPLTELSGKYLFPRDFGEMRIPATKDCIDCKKEETTIYAILTKEPIKNISKLTNKELISLKSQNLYENKMNIYCGVIKFYVE